MRLFGHEIESYKQWLVVFVVVLLVASGLCGVQWAIVAGASGRLDPLVPLFILLGALEGLLMAVSAVGILLVLVLWPIAILLNRGAKRPKDNVQRSFEDAVISNEEQSKESSNEEPNDR
jgi:hypothetical protein